MHWIFCGLIIFGFAAPSAVVGVPYAIGTQGVLIGVFLCLIYTLVTISGSMLLLELAYKYKDITEFKDVGKQILGPVGEIFATIIQNANFFLFLPIAMDLVASAAQGVLDPSFDTCTDYYIIAVAGICLSTTQIRTLSNADYFAAFSVLCTLCVGILIIYVSFTTDNPSKEDADLAGNPDSMKTKEGFTDALLGVTTAVWSYVPAFLVIELKEAVPAKNDLRKAIFLSGFLNVCFYITIGVIVVNNWGWDMADPVTVLPYWPSHSDESKALNACLFVANLISYGLSSVPMTRKYVQWMQPDFRLNEWSIGSSIRFLSLSMIPWVMALLIAILTPNVFVLLAFVTAFTVPWVTMIIPAFCYLKDNDPSSTVDDDDLFDSSSLLPSISPEKIKITSDDPIQKHGKLIAKFVLFVGIVTFLVCLLAAIGKVSLKELRGPSIIGCDGWMILEYGDDT